MSGFVVRYNPACISHPAFLSPSASSGVRPQWPVVRHRGGSRTKDPIGRSDQQYARIVHIPPQRYFPTTKFGDQGLTGSQKMPCQNQSENCYNKAPLSTYEAPLFTQEDLNQVLYGRDYFPRMEVEKQTAVPTDKDMSNDSPTGCKSSEAIRKARCMIPQIPTGLEVRAIPGQPQALSTQGVFSTSRLECGIRFGPYTGKRVYLSEVKSNDDNSRMWEVFINGQLNHFIDGRGSCANWMTYVRCARTRQEQNVVVTQYDDDIFYEVCDVIEPETELLVWYGEDYELYLGIPTGLKLSRGKGEIQREEDRRKDEKSSDQGYQCNRCGKMFAYTYYRDKHLKYTRCVDGGDRKFPCDLCSRSFEKRDRLRIHVLHVHEKHRPHKCHVCQKTFSQSSSLNKHMRVHNGDRPYKCVYCGKAFTASSILRTHIRQHSGEKPFKCKFCGKSFASHAAHDSHVRRTHAQFGVGQDFTSHSQGPFPIENRHDDRDPGESEIIGQNNPKEMSKTREIITSRIPPSVITIQYRHPSQPRTEEEFINVDE